MSNYNNYGGPQSGAYNQGAGGYDNSYNNPNAYPQQPQYGAQYGGQGYDSQNFGPPRRADSFGPPQHGGFQHGQQGGQYGDYYASNPQGQPGYYGGNYQPQNPQYGGQQYGAAPTANYGAPNDAFAANQAYQNQMATGGQQSYPPASGQQQYQFNSPEEAQRAAQNHNWSRQSTDPNAPNYDPSAPPMTESDRGLLGAIGGGFAGNRLGGKAGHGILGTIGGAIMGSFAEDFLKNKKKTHGSSSGGSQWGGGKW